MSSKRKVTVHLSVWFEDMQMEDTSAGLDLIRSVVTLASRDCEAEIKNALELAGARDVVFKMAAY